MKVDLYLHQQGIDTTTPAGKAMFQMCGVFAEFERAMIRERVNAGLARARARGKKLGRPKISRAFETAVCHERAKGKGIARVAAEVGCGVGTVNRILAEAAQGLSGTPLSLTGAGRLNGTAGAVYNDGPRKRYTSTNTP